MTRPTFTELDSLKRMVAYAKAAYESSDKSPAAQDEYISRLTVLTARMHEYADRVEESAREKKAELEKAKGDLEESRSKTWELNEKIARLKTGNKSTWSEN